MKKTNDIANELETAVKWFMDMPVGERIKISDRYFPEYSEDNLDLDDEEILSIYKTEAVNNYQSLKESNAALILALDNILGDVLNLLDKNKVGLGTVGAIHIVQAKQALNKAKNI